MFIGWRLLKLTCYPRNVKFSIGLFEMFHISMFLYINDFWVSDIVEDILTVFRKKTQAETRLEENKIYSIKVYSD